MQRKKDETKITGGKNKVKKTPVKSPKMKWIGREEINSVYIDAISVVHRKGAMKIELGQVISTAEEEKEENQQRVKIVSSFVMDPHFLKYQVLEVLESQIKEYEEAHGVLKLEEGK